MDQQPNSEPRRFGLGWALLASAVLHLALILISFVVPITSQSAIPEPQPDTVLKFDFADATDPELQGSTESMMPIPAQQPRQLPQVARTAPSAPTQIPVPPQPQTPPAQQNPEPRADQPHESAEDPTRAEESPFDEPREADDPGEPSGSELLEQPDGRFANPPAAPESGTPAEPGGRNISLGRALEEYRNQLAQRPPPRPGQYGAGSQPSVFVPNAGDWPMRGVGIDNLIFETRDFDWEDYARQIYNEILRAWYKRLYATTGEFEKWAYGNTWELNHWTQIRFVIENSGDVTTISVEIPATCDPLDQSAVQALDEVILPPLPRDFPKSREVVHARFIARGHIFDMRPYFRRLERQGYFDAPVP